MLRNSNSFLIVALWIAFYWGYNIDVNISFDPTKSQINAVKHGVALEQAAYMEWDNAVIWRDERREYMELRYCALAYIELRLYCVSFTDRADTRRIISLRRANKREINRYANT